MFRIKECKSVYELARHLNLSVATITNILYNVKTDNCYKKYTIPKKSGGSRIICAPNAELKSIQKRLANALYTELKLIREEECINAKISHAFEKKKSIITNCEIHKKKRFVLNVDLEDFFGHFHYGRVYGYFLKNKHFLCTDETARTIANLACFKSKLPQGAPTSPIITNLIFQAVDIRILQLTRKYHLDYTRYADDLTFSTNRRDFFEVYKDFLNELEKLLKHSGFEINNNKIRISFQDSRQTVTGLIVNNKINVNADYFKLVRAYANSFYKTGEYHIKDKNDKATKKGTANQLEGMLSFIRMIDRHNRKGTLSDPIKQQQSLTKRDKEYQRFLFYKYFYKNDRPLIITEGKTDQIYLKCALKKYYQKFPKLIKKTKNGFQFNVQFMKRSKRMHEMFSFVKDGADAMSNFYKNFYANKVNYNFPDYYQYFSKITSQAPSNPVLFIFDNEINNKSKPLANFIGLLEKKNTSAYRDKIIENGWIRIMQNKNLYAVTHQLVDSMSECEIEDLFTKDTLEAEVRGKTFSREKNYDTNEHFGKDHFSKIIAKNYEQIDFSNFITFLERIQNAISDYSDNDN